MEAALYPPQHGYYRSRREKMGREGDYLTSPEVSPIFGVLLGRQLREMWQTMGEPRRFDLVEVLVGWDGVHFVEELRPPSRPELEPYFRRLGLLPGEGCAAEVNLAALEWMRQAGAGVRAGLLLPPGHGHQ